MRASFIVTAISSLVASVVFAAACSSPNTVTNTDAGPSSGGNVGTNFTVPDSACPSSDDCVSCCVNNHLDGATVYNSAWGNCACFGTNVTGGGAGPCATACENTLCVNQAADDNCFTCLYQVLDNACNAAVVNACNGNSDCVSYVNDCQNNCPQQ